jgi:hypothetical protein
MGKPFLVVDGPQAALSVMPSLQDFRSGLAVV